MQKISAIENRTSSRWTDYASAALLWKPEQVYPGSDNSKPNRFELDETMPSKYSEMMNGR
jgi:hypothetical protein